MCFTSFAATVMTFVMTALLCSFCCFVQQFYWTQPTGKLALTVLLWMCSYLGLEAKLKITDSGS